MFELAEPSHELRGETPRDSIRHQEVEVFLQGDLGDERADGHGFKTSGAS
jgi:hypothetical protein